MHPTALLGIALVYGVLLVYAIAGGGVLLALASDDAATASLTVLLLGVLFAPLVVAVTCGGKLLYRWRRRQRMGRVEAATPVDCHTDALLGAAQLLGVSAGVSGVLSLGVLLYAELLVPRHSRVRYLRGALVAFVAQLIAYGIAAFYRVLRPTPTPVAAEEKKAA